MGNASEVIDVPLTMGGGISILEDIGKVLPPAPTRSAMKAPHRHIFDRDGVGPFPAVYINGKGDYINGKGECIYFL